MKSEKRFEIKDIHYPPKYFVNTEVSEVAELSERIARLENSVNDIEKLIKKIQSLAVYRLLKRIKIYYRVFIRKVDEAYDKFFQTRVCESLRHFWGRFTKQYYFEDYIRVYPDGVLFDHRGRPLKAGDDALKNYLNHVKFYKFVAQFVKNKKVVDVGCGSGYGCRLIKKFGASEVYGADISKHAIQFANSHYGNDAEFSVQSITNLKQYPDNFFDVTVSSEVIEHIKEYGVEQKAIEELKRITIKNGLLIVATPNSEMLEEHGFSYDELQALFKNNFSNFCIFENALIPSDNARLSWEKRLQEKRVGIIVSEQINLSETFLPDGIVPEIKTGIQPGAYNFETYEIDTRLLHNTHSWIGLAVNTNMSKDRGGK
jgi:2-polyprenyl-3-methyl-5-hydroxy-6-metoxy-1,4-benzoquinol methylase